MTAKVAPLEQFFEVVWQTDCIKLDGAIFKLLNATRVDIPGDVVLRVEELKGNDNLVEHIQCLFVGHVLLAKGFPLAHGVWGLHLHEDQVVGHDPITINRHQVLVLETGKRLNHLKCVAAFFLVESGDVDAGDHFVFVGVHILYEENLAISLAVVQRHHQVGVVLGVGRVLAHTQLLLTEVGA